MYKIDAQELKFLSADWVAGLNAVKDELNSKGSHLVADWHYLDMMQCLLDVPAVDIVFRLLDHSGKEVSTIDKVFKSMTNISAACIAIDAFYSISKKAIEDFEDSLSD